ncbi:MAG: glutamyl-tRNA amidotransferase [Candidatus Marinimicrobia bacterium]|nr:glutamyl-tRNA amidotransferase [Candidatus Neomarinimicrobiota bacterium]
MSINNQIQNDMYNAMKSGDKQKANVLRITLAKLKDKAIDKREELTKQEEIKVLQTLVKQRKESIELYVNGGRNDLAEAEQKELEILNDYLPKMMDDNDVKNIVKSVIDEVGATSMADMGKIMPEVMKRGKGLIDGKSAQKFVQELIG